MTACTVVVDRDDGVVVLLAHGTDSVVGTLLHFGIRALDSVQLDIALILTCCHARYCATTHTDTVVVATEQNDLITSRRLIFQAVDLATIADTSGLHNHLVVTELLALLAVLEGEQRTADQRLTELVTEVACTIRCLDQNVGRSLIEPLTRGHLRLPRVRVVQTRISGHIHRSTCNGERALTTSDTVADLTARTRRCTVERLYGCGEVMGLGLDRDNALEILNRKVIRHIVTLGCELLNNRTLQECAVVLVSRRNAIGVSLCCMLDQVEQRRRFLLAIDHERTAEDLVAAVLRIHLRETEHLAVGQRATHLLAYLFEVCDLLLAQSQTLSLVVALDVIDIDDLLGLFVDNVDRLIQSLVATIQHRIERGVLAVGNELLDAADTFQTHILGNFHSIGTPRGDHFAAWTDELTVDTIALDELCAREKPLQFFDCRLIELYATIHSVDFVILCKKQNHNLLFYIVLLVISHKVVQMLDDVIIASASAVDHDRSTLVIDLALRERTADKLRYFLVALACNERTFFLVATQTRNENLGR